MTFTEELKARGLVEQSSADLEKILSTKRTVYLGVDPSADSMQAGNLVVILMMRRLAMAGHKIILLVGGGTGMIGDPRESGERSLPEPKVVAKNKKALKAQMQKIVGAKVMLVDNADWLLKIKLVEFLRDIGKHFTVNELVKRDIIRRRLETPDESISYTEFAYSLLQGYDYMMLNQKHGADLQIGGNDQWTNLLSGVELIRRKQSKEAFVFTVPLVTDAAGKKFGKSEGNAIWLDAKKTSPYQFYQFWLNQPDEVVERYLKMYSFIPLEGIDELMQKHRENPGAREAQETLARVVTELVHGPAAAATAAAASSALFGGDLANLPPEAKSVVLAEAPTLKTSVGTPVLDALVESGLASSKSEARRLIEAKGVSVNGKVVESADQALTASDFVNGLGLMKKGKRDICVLVAK
ncbi:MAG: tyrosine--tRNA ligase [Patescibacteria group bacterium]